MEKSLRALLLLLEWMPTECLAQTCHFRDLRPGQLPYEEITCLPVTFELEVIGE